MTAPTDAEIVALAAEIGMRVRTGKGAVVFTRAVLAKWGHPQEVAGGETVGSLSIQHFRGSRSMENVDFDYFGKLDPGTYQVYTAPPPQAAPDPLTDEQCDAIYEALDVFGRDVCQYDYGLPHQIDDTPAKQLARNHIRSAAHSITKGGQP